MVDRGANIDIVFRNGLKDFEVMLRQRYGKIFNLS